MPDLLDVFSALWPAVLGGAAGWYYSKYRGSRAVIRALLWIILRRVQMGVFFSPFERAIVREAQKMVK